METVEHKIVYSFSQKYHIFVVIGKIGQQGGDRFTHIAEGNFFGLTHCLLAV